MLFDSIFYPQLLLWNKKQLSVWSLDIIQHEGNWFDQCLSRT